ncbi:ATP-dependent DNA ligase [Streptomyces sp. NPDC052042]|uniref:ATP-dependent DNA ligase n=1 Tax=Streptomyces sp. NPDC052042 TaxID=3365683 RepID=UPI0037CE421E
MSSPDLPAGHAAEPKWDGYRCRLEAHGDELVVLRSRRGADLTGAFPEVRQAALDRLPAGTGLDGELVVWEDGRLAFDRLQARAATRGARAAAASREQPAHFVAFDLLHRGDTDLTGWPYGRRREALEQLFAENRLTAPLTLCPSTTDPAVARQWLDWTAAGLEGLVIKRLDERYLPGRRTWHKYRIRHTTEAIVAAVSGPLSAPRTLLLARYDTAGQLHFVGRTTVLSSDITRALTGQLAPPGELHPWQGRSFSAGWGSRDTLDVVLVRPEVVLEIGADVARDSAGRWRHPVRPYRVRTDLDVQEVPRQDDQPPDT